MTDGKGNKSGISLRDQCIVFDLQAYYRITKIKVEGGAQVKNNFAQLVFYLGKERNLCGSLKSDLLNKTSKEIFCDLEEEYSDLILCVEENIVIKQLSVFGQFISQNGSNYYYKTLGCFQLNFLYEIQKVFTNLQECFAQCKEESRTTTIGVNVEFCLCVKNLKNITTADSCIEKCPKSNYICGVEGSFSLLEDKNMCLDEETNGCNSKISICEPNGFGRFKCFCKNTDKPVRAYAADNDCHETETSKKKIKVIDKKFERFEGTKIIETSKIFPSRMKLTLKSSKRTSLTFSPNCKSRLTYCSITMTLGEIVYCPKDFVNESFNKLLNKGDVYVIEFIKNNSIPDYEIKCFMTFKAVDPFTMKTRRIDITMETEHYQFIILFEPEVIMINDDNLFQMMITIKLEGGDC